MPPATMPHTDDETPSFEVEFPPRTTAGGGPAAAPSSSIPIHRVTTNNSRARGGGDAAAPSADFASKWQQRASTDAAPTPGYDYDYDYAADYDGPVDLDQLFREENLGYNSQEDGIFRDDDDHEAQAGKVLASEEDEQVAPRVPKFFSNPHRRLLDNDASLIPGSPFSKPANKASTRPQEPLTLAKYASTLAFGITLLTVGGLLFAAIWNYNSVGRVLVEVVLAIISFFGLFWNSYFSVAMICKCFIPAKAFTSNTKYCSITPETKDPNAAWLDVTIQIPVYKESLLEVLIPTLKSCMASRDYYIKNTKARCNIVVCDDGMMNYLRDNFPAAEMLWETILETKGRVVKLGRLLKLVPRASRRHLKGLRSKNVHEVFHRMLFYYHYNIGFVARSTVDRRGKFKKASNLNSHLRLAFGAAQLAGKEGDMTFNEALLCESHNDDGSRYVMFGNDIKLGHLIVVNDADARMAESVTLKTVPEFLNDNTLGFTQHATKTMNEQRGETYFTNLLTVYTDALYQGHFLLSSILGCHPPLVGHSIFLRSEAVKQVGRMRTLRKAQRWLQNIGLPFLPVDQVGFGNLQAENRIEYWSENHVSEDFELMIHLYNLGFNGRYCAYPNCEFQEGITRTFDEEAGRHRKFALGAHELVFNPFQDMVGMGIFTPLFNTFLKCDIPSYYKVFLTAYLCSYTSGGCYIIVFLAAALARIFDSEQEVRSLEVFSPASIIILNFIIYYILGYITFLISLIRMNSINSKLLFPEYRKKYCGSSYLVFVMLRYCFIFQFFFYSVATFSFYFLGSMDHLLSRPGMVGATNKDSIELSRCVAFWDMARFNRGSWIMALILGGVAYATVLETTDWDPTVWPEDFVSHALFAGPPIFIAAMSFLVPIFFNPYILGWPFLHKSKKQAPPKQPVKKDALGREIVDINTFMNRQLSAIERTMKQPDVEIGSLETKDLKSYGTPTVASPKSIRMSYLKAKEQELKAARALPDRMAPISEFEPPLSTRTRPPSSGGNGSSHGHHPGSSSSGHGSNHNPRRSHTPPNTRAPAGTRSSKPRSSTTGRGGNILEV